MLFEQNRMLGKKYKIVRMVGNPRKNSTFLVSDNANNDKKNIVKVLVFQAVEKCHIEI